MSGSTPSPPPSPDATLQYPLVIDETGGCMWVYGKPGASKLLLVSAGYPDDQSGLAPLAARLAKENDCLAGVICLPGYDDRPEDGKPWSKHPKQGYTFEECADAFTEAAKALRKHSTNPKATFSGMFHDWGVAVGLMYTNRALRENPSLAPNQLVVLDVILAFPRSPKIFLTHPLSTFYQMLVLNIYQHAFALSFLIGRYISPSLGSMAQSLLVQILGFLYLFPLISGDPLPSKPFETTGRAPYMAYIYALFWQCAYTGKMLQYADKDFVLPLEKASVLYLYGKKKRMNFHFPDMIEYLNSDKDPCRQSKAVGIDGGGHWFYHQKPEETYRLVQPFLFPDKKTN